MATRAIGLHDGFDASIVGENGIVTIGWSSAIQNSFYVVIATTNGTKNKNKNQIFFHVLVVRST
jgi:hypothetical protein